MPNCILAREAPYPAAALDSTARAWNIPVVSENCLMCHANFKGNKGNVGALSYTVPLIE